MLRLKLFTGARNALLKNLNVIEVTADLIAVSRTLLGVTVNASLSVSFFGFATMSGNDMPGSSGASNTNPRADVPKNDSVRILA